MSSAAAVLWCPANSWLAGRSRSDRQQKTNSAAYANDGLGSQFTSGDVATARRSLGRYFTFYNTERKHQALDDRTPDDVHYSYAAKLAA
jgi:transposase InsO family protein